MTTIEPRPRLSLSTKQRPRSPDRRDTPEPAIRVHDGAAGVPAVSERVHYPSHEAPPRRRTPTTPLQPLPPIGPATARKTLTACEDAVLTLVTLDPRLGALRRREVLRLLAALLHPDFDAAKVGRALRRLREYHQRGQVFTPAFLPPSPMTRRLSVRDRLPDAATAVTVIEALVLRYGGHVDPPAGRVPYALRLLGIEA